MGMMKALAAVTALISATNAHMVIVSPVPMGKSVLTNAPLDANGDNFPCKNTVTGWDNIADGGGNVMTVGESNTLSFMGGATHGGGSCQVSITTDTPPTKNSNWMVIKSIEGNCPVDSTETENTSGSATNTNGLNSFQYTIPDHPDLPAGKNYTLAWTWNNRIGNREFYMNCASVQLEAAKKKRYAPENYKRQSSSLPAMFVANIGTGCDTEGCPNGCTVPELIDLKYPDPGSDVDVGQGLTFTLPTGNCGAVSDSSSTSSGGGGNSSSPDTGSNSGTPSGSSPTSVAQSAGGSFATNTAGSGAPAVSSPSSAASSPAAQPPAPAESATGLSSAPASAPTSSSSNGTGTGSGSSSTSASGTQSGPCTDEGQWSCAADGKSYQRCASGQWSVPMSMSAGMTCTPGTSDTFTQNAVSGSGKRKRVIRRGHRVRTMWE